MLAEDPPGLSIHESATISGVWPVMPCYSNLVLFDPLKPQETADTIVPELAERWSWQDGYRNPVAPREEPRRAPLALQLGADAGSLARPLSPSPT
jgi:hypothetical protein